MKLSIHQALQASGIFHLSLIQYEHMTYNSMAPGSEPDCCQTDLDLNPDSLLELSLEALTQGTRPLILRRL